MRFFSAAAVRDPVQQRYMARVWQGFIAFLVFGILVGVVSNIAVAVFLTRAADFRSEALRALVLNNTDAVPLYEQQSIVATQQSILIAAVQRVTEAAVLLILISVYFIIGIRSYRIISAALRTLFKAEQLAAAKERGANQSSSAQRQLISDASDQGQKLLLKVAITFILVFISLLVRSLFHWLYAFAQGGQDYANSCSSSQCSTCKNVNRFPSLCTIFRVIRCAGFLQHSMVDHQHPHRSNGTDAGVLALVLGCRAVGHVWSAAAPIISCYSYYFEHLISFLSLSLLVQVFAPSRPLRLRPLSWRAQVSAGNSHVRERYKYKIKASIYRRSAQKLCKFKVQFWFSEPKTLIDFVKKQTK